MIAVCLQLSVKGALAQDPLHSRHIDLSKQKKAKVKFLTVEPLLTFVGHTCAFPALTSQNVCHEKGLYLKGAHLVLTSLHRWQKGDVMNEAFYFTVFAGIKVIHNVR